MRKLLAVSCWLLPSIMFACGSDDAGGGSSNPPGGAPWKSTTHPFDPTCASCKPLGTGQIAHAGEADLLADTVTDDPTAQWSRCMLSFMHCIDDGKAIRECVAGSVCPAVCKAAYEKALASGSEVQAVDRTFFDADAPCTLPEPKAVTP
ncbi:MAG: hypothetical protein U0263_13275 [Polyangiaceae bacterium]